MLRAFDGARMTSNSTLIETVSKVTRVAYRLAVRKVDTPPRLVTNRQTDGQTQDDSVQYIALSQLAR